MLPSPPPLAQAPPPLAQAPPPLAQAHPLLKSLKSQARLARAALIPPLRATRLRGIDVFVKRAIDEARARGWPFTLSICKSSGDRHLLRVDGNGDSKVFVVNYDPYLSCGWLAFKDEELYDTSACAAAYDGNFVTSSELVFWCWELLGGVVPHFSEWRRLLSIEETRRDAFKATVALIRKDLRHLSDVEFSDFIKSNTYPDDMSDEEFKDAMKFMLVA